MVNLHRIYETVAYLKTTGAELGPVLEATVNVLLTPSGTHSTKHPTDEPGVRDTLTVGKLRQITCEYCQQAETDVDTSQDWTAHSLLRHVWQASWRIEELTRLAGKGQQGWLTVNQLRVELEAAHGVLAQHVRNLKLEQGATAEIMGPWYEQYHKLIDELSATSSLTDRCWAYAASIPGLAAKLTSQLHAATGRAELPAPHTGFTSIASDWLASRSRRSSLDLRRGNLDAAANIAKWLEGEHVNERAATVVGQWQQTVTDEVEQLATAGWGTLLHRRGVARSTLYEVAVLQFEARLEHAMVDVLRIPLGVAYTVAHHDRQDATAVAMLDPADVPDEVLRTGIELWLQDHGLFTDLDVAFDSALRLLATS